MTIGRVEIAGIVWGNRASVRSGLSDAETEKSWGIGANEIRWEFGVTIG